jgi:enoyl-CoA hydratase
MLKTSREGTTLTCTLDRPDKRNALSAELVEQLLGEIEQAAQTGVRLLVLRGEGKNFSAGFDFTGTEDASEGDLLLRFVRIETLLQAVAHAPFETLALAHGKNFGAGVDLIAACNRRVATPDASFMMPGLGFGLVLGTRRYAGLVGTSRARHVLNDGVTFSAETALQDGFLTDIAAADAWDDTIVAVRKAAERLTPDAAARLARTAVNDTRDADMAELVRSAAMPGLKQRIQAYRS